MPRATNAPASHRRKKRVLKQAKGFRGTRSKVYKKAAEAVDRAMQMAYVHRKQKKRSYRQLWIARVSAACRSNDITYSRLMEGLTKGNITLNRKMLSEIAIHDAEGFSHIVSEAKKNLS